MPDPKYFLTDRDLAALKKLAGEVHRHPVNTGAPQPTEVHSPYLDSSQAPEVYFARAPESGIPAAYVESNTIETSGDYDYLVPGSAECKAHSFVEDLLMGIAGDGRFGVSDTQTIRCLNPYDVDIPGKAWLLAVRTKGGQFMVVSFIPSDSLDTGTGTGDVTSSGCKTCDWLAGMGLTRCLRISVNGIVTDLYLTTLDGDAWSSTDLLSICGIDYAVRVSRNAGGIPLLTLTEPGSGGAVHTGQWKCCDCAYVKWGFNLQELCPDEPDTGDPCTNVVEVRADYVVCSPTGGPSCPEASEIGRGQVMSHQSQGDVALYWRMNVTAGQLYHISWTAENSLDPFLPCAVGAVGNLLVPVCNHADTTTTLFSIASTTNESGCTEFTPGEDGCLCIQLTVSPFATPPCKISATVRVGACPP